MIILAALILGALLGDWRARRMGGNGKDRTQYAAVHAVALVIPAVFLTIILDRISRG